MVSGVSLDAVVLCSPSGLHASQGVLAADRGVHVIAEKPLATTATDADLLLDACARNGVRLAVIHQFRYSAPVTALRHVIESGALGRIVFVNIALFWRRSPAYYAENGGWRGTWKWDGGGTLMNQGCHAVDLARWLGGPIETVSAFTTNVCHEIEAEDTVSATVAFARGGLGNLQVTTCAGENHPAVIRVEGTSGSAVVSGTTLIVNGGPSTELLRSAEKPPASPHKLQFDEIFSALAAGEPPPVAGEDARETLLATLAMYESARSGLVVRLVSGRGEADDGRRL